MNVMCNVRNADIEAIRAAGLRGEIMIKLPELAEQAKFIADWHGGDWSSALCQDKDGNQSHEIICESREESVISTGNNSNESSWLCDYLEMCSPENIIAIAKYVAELEQRLNATAQPVSDGYKVPEGWKLVPVVPTDKMINAALGIGGFTIRSTYTSMISAAPAAPGGQDD